MSTLLKASTSLDKSPAFRQFFAFSTHILIYCPVTKFKSQTKRGIMANIHTPIPSLKLNDGNSMPMIAYGTGTAWSKGRRPGTEVDRALVESIKSALEMGYRHIDCAESA
jgi:hypothetical protein